MATGILAMVSHKIIHKNVDVSSIIKLQVLLLSMSGTRSKIYIATRLISFNSFLK